MTTAPLDLSDNATAPDFVALSFYKIFGYPDLGALLVRKDSGHILQWRKYFGGGTVDMITAIDDCWHMRKDYTVDDRYSLHDQLEDGTLPFHSILALDTALDVQQHLFGTMSDVSKHTTYLTKRLFDHLSALRHWNGTPLCRIYNDATAKYGDSKTQGATVAFNVQKPDGSLVPYSEIERVADEHAIHIRSGGLCNPGGIATHLSLRPWEMKRAWSSGHRCGHATEIISGKPTGVVRASLGAMSTKSDVDRLVKLLSASYVERQAASKSSLYTKVAIDSSGIPPKQSSGYTVVAISESDSSLSNTQLMSRRDRHAKKWIRRVSSRFAPKRPVKFAVSTA